MPLKARLSSIDGLDDSIKPFYKETEPGSFVLDVEESDGYDLENISGLRKTLQDWRSKHQKVQERLKEFGGLEPDEVRAALKSSTGGEAKTKQAEIERLQAAVKQADGERKTAVGEVRLLLLDGEIDRAIAKHKANPFLRDVLKSRDIFDLEDDDSGRPVPVVKGDDGNVRMSIRDGAAYRTTIEEKLTELSKDTDYAAFFPGSGASGSGARGGGEGGSGNLGTPKMVGWNDQAAISANLEDIAKGKVTLGPPME